MPIFGGTIETPQELYMHERGAEDGEDDPRAALLRENLEQERAALEKAQQLGQQHAQRTAVAV